MNKVYTDSSAHNAKFISVNQIRRIIYSGEVWMLVLHVDKASLGPIAGTLCLGVSLLSMTANTLCNTQILNVFP